MRFGVVPGGGAPGERCIDAELLVSPESVRAGAAPTGENGSVVKLLRCGAGDLHDPGVASL